jgi:DNA-binding transcriptional regulator PaaX
MAEQTGHCEKWIRAQLTRLKAAGRLEMVRVQRERLDGRMSPVMAYRMKA